jgi:hypothetical protein
VSGNRRLASLVAAAALAALLAVATVEMLAHPYDVGRYRAPQVILGVVAFGAVLLAVE